MINSRFSIQVHIVSLLAISKDAITSDYIASSINCNAVLVRKELSVLKKAGIVATQEGKNGGVRLAKEPERIFLDMLFQLTSEGAHLFSGSKNIPNPLCAVGRSIDTMMSAINADAERSLLRSLHKTNIGDLVKNFVE